MFVSIFVLWCQARRISCQAVSGKANRGQGGKKSRATVARMRNRNQRREGGSPAVLAHCRGRSGASFQDSNVVKRKYKNNLVVWCGVTGACGGQMRCTPGAPEIGGKIACYCARVRTHDQQMNDDKNRPAGSRFLAGLAGGARMTTSFLPARFPGSRQNL